jgi:hypothetical protein
MSVSKRGLNMVVNINDVTPVWQVIGIDVVELLARAYRPPRQSGRDACTTIYRHTHRGPCEPAGKTGV